MSLLMGSGVIQSLRTHSDILLSLLGARKHALLFLMIRPYPREIDSACFL